MRNSKIWMASISLAALLALSTAGLAQEADSKAKGQEAQAGAQEAKAKEKAAKLKAELDARARELDAKSKELQAQAKALESQAKGREDELKTKQEAREQMEQRLLEMRAEAHPESMANAVIPIQHADVKEVADVLRTFQGVLGGRVVPNPELRVIAVSGPKELVAACEEAIKKLDVPSKPARSVDLTFFLLIASRQAGGSSAEVPPDLERVCDQLKGVTGFKSFRLVDTMLLRAKEGSGAEQKGLLPTLTQGGNAKPYWIRFNYAHLTPGEKTLRIQLSGLRLGAELENLTASSGASSISTHDAGISTDIEFGEGQKAVVGVTGAGAHGDALVLVVAGKTAE
jgi:hypothetical protein